LNMPGALARQIYKSWLKRTGKNYLCTKITEMAGIGQRLRKWNETRSFWQKAGDILFWMLLVLLIIPGPRKVISTAVNRVILHVKNPGMFNPEKQIRLEDRDYAWMLRDLQDEPVSMKAFRGEVIFLNHWATWCPPCVAELPEIRRAYEKHGNRVQFLLVTGEEPSVVRLFLKKRGYEGLPVYFTSSPPPSSLQAGAIPTTFIISGDGRIVTRKTGAVNWDSRATSRIFDHLVR